MDINKNNIVEVQLDSNRYCNISSCIPITTEEYDELVKQILNATSSYNLSISNLDTLFKQIIEDLKNTIIPSG